MQAPPALVTTTTAMTVLGRNRAQVQRLIRANLLPAPHHHGRAMLIDPAALQSLVDRRGLADTGDPHDTAYALALHLGPRTPEAHPDRYERDHVGWDAARSNDDDQWTGWWNCGTAIADTVSHAELPLLPAVSGFVVAVCIATGYHVHPLYPGLIRFTITEPDTATIDRFANTVFIPSPGSPWQRLWTPSA